MVSTDKGGAEIQVTYPDSQRTVGPSEEAVDDCVEVQPQVQPSILSSKLNNGIYESRKSEEYEEA